MSALGERKAWFSAQARVDRYPRLLSRFEVGTRGAGLAAGSRGEFSPKTSLAMTSTSGCPIAPVSSLAISRGVRCPLTGCGLAWVAPLGSLMPLASSARSFAGSLVSPVALPRSPRNLPSVSFILPFVSISRPLLLIVIHPPSEVGRPASFESGRNALNSMRITARGGQKGVASSAGMLPSIAGRSGVRAGGRSRASNTQCLTVPGFHTIAIVIIARPFVVAPHAALFRGLSPATIQRYAALAQSWPRVAANATSAVTPTRLTRAR